MVVSLSRLLCFAVSNVSTVSNARQRLYLTQKKRADGLSLEAGEATKAAKESDLKARQALLTAETANRETALLRAEIENKQEMIERMTESRAELAKKT
ncbi:hypothetical protein KIPB_011107, partial [Kipferlia bialata]|eukprot:g11107.t1